MSSPRPWGCFSCSPLMPSMTAVFPTPVGVFLPIFLARRAKCRLPHARGGVSVSKGSNNTSGVSSPRPWGCFSGAPCRQTTRSVFPTPVGVFLAPTMATLRCWGLPHARGGVSRWVSRIWTIFESSPRPWGCFPNEQRQDSETSVFPTPVGVFLTGPLPTGSGSSLPHARGGVSATNLQFVEEALSSPRPWGCFLSAGRICFLHRVFPTPVGVFPGELEDAIKKHGLPHARGGVSVTTSKRRNGSPSSPRPWGCFPDERIR